MKLQIKFNSFLVIVLAIFGFNQAVFGENVYYNIAHMLSTKKLIDWGISQGANAVEADLHFVNGVPAKFSHGPGLCECTFTGIAKATANIPLIKDITKRLYPPVCQASSDPCGVSENATDWFNHLATKSNVALLIIDTKTGSIKDNEMATAGKNVIKMINQELFNRGFKGTVIVGVPEFNGLPYLRAAAQEASSSAYKDRTFFAVDQESDALKTIKELASFTKNRAYGVGLPSFVPIKFFSAISLASRNEKAGVIGFTYIWTIDDRDIMKKYIETGARGIMTDDPKALFEVYKQLGKTLAKPSDALPIGQSDTVVK